MDPFLFIHISFFLLRTGLSLRISQFGSYFQNRAAASLTPFPSDGWPSPLFVLTLMWVFKRKSFCILITNPFLSQNARSSSLLLPSSHPYPFSPIILPHHISGKKSEFFLSQGEGGCLRSPCRSWGGGSSWFRAVHWGGDGARPRCERLRPRPVLWMLGQTHVNGWSRIVASQNGGSTSYIFPLRLGVLQWSHHLFNNLDK